jgi:cation:H+ antiporter
VFAAGELAVGLCLLVLGGWAVVEGGSRLARLLGVSELTIGLTVVAFGTSAPELAVNVTAALAGDGDIAFGNVVGSNIVNVALGIGLCALVRPIRLGSELLGREIPMMWLATLAAAVLGLDRVRGEPEHYDRSDGLVLLLFFAVFLWYTTAGALARRAEAQPLEAPERGEHRPAGARAVALLLTLCGLVALVVGGRLAVSGAEDLAAWLGVPQDLIALTVLAVGTSLPEIVTSVIATARGQLELALGNVVGSNIFNLLFILAVSALIDDVNVPAGAVDLIALAFFSFAILPLALVDAARAARWPGAALVGSYLAYIAWRAAP